MARLSTDEAARILGVERDAKLSDLNKAWRKLARTCHPDTHPGDEKARKQFIKLNVAFTTLSEIQEGVRRKHSLVEDMLDHEFERWIKVLSPEKQQQIKDDLELIDKEDAST